jgi:hypothetical protein
MPSGGRGPVVTPASGKTCKAGETQKADPAGRKLPELSPRLPECSSPTPGLIQDERGGGESSPDLFPAILYR